MALWDILAHCPARGAARAAAVLALAALLGAGQAAAQTYGTRLDRASASIAVREHERPVPGPFEPAVHIVHPHLSQRYAAEDDRFRFEPWAGALWDAYRNDGGDGRPAWLAALRFAYEPGTGVVGGRVWRLMAEIGRAEAAEAGNAIVDDSLEVVFRTEWWLATGGAEYDILAGWTGLTLEAHGGAAWIEREIVGGDSIAPGTPGTSERAQADPVPAFVIGLSGYRHLTHRLQLRLRLADVVTDPFADVEHSPALGLGLRFVFE